MLISEILKNLEYEYEIIDEKEINSLGLAGYNNSDKVCTFLDDIKYIDDISGDVVMLITKKEIGDILKKDSKKFGIIIVEEPRNTFFKVHNYLSNNKEYIGENFKTKIGKGCIIDKTALIAKENVVIGNNVIIEEFVSIKENTIIGDNSIIRAGSRIGGEGFEFKKTKQETFLVKHVGKVVIGNSVEVQYNTCIDKAIYPWDTTFIGDNVKIDNLVHIAHGVKIGKGSMIVANTGIGGRVTIGDEAWIGFGATLRNGITIGNHARANMGAVVSKSIKDNEAVTGNFAIEHNKFISRLKKEAKNE